MLHCSTQSFVFYVKLGILLVSKGVFPQSFFGHLFQGGLSFINIFVVGFVTFFFTSCGKQETQQNKYYTVFRPFLVLFSPFTFTLQFSQGLLSSLAFQIYSSSIHESFFTWLKRRNQILPKTRMERKRKLETSRKYLENKEQEDYYWLS